MVYLVTYIYIKNYLQMYQFCPHSCINIAKFLMAKTIYHNIVWLLLLKISIQLSSQYINITIKWQNQLIAHLIPVLANRDETAHEQIA